MVNDAFIAACKPGCVVINTSRGKVIDMKSLLRALKSGQVKGACLDVLPYEPPAKGPEEDQRLFLELSNYENVVLSPHIAGWTVESKRKIATVLLDKIQSFVNLPQ